MYRVRYRSAVTNLWHTLFFGTRDNAREFLLALKGWASDVTIREIRF